MGVLEFERLVDAGDVHFTPSTTAGLAFLSVCIAFIYSIFQDFAKAFVKPPSHFPKRRWFDFSSPPKVDVPLVELDESGDYRRLLERGAKQASYTHLLRMLKRASTYR